MKVGLTGGIGCGKSTVTGIFRDAGWKTVESDRVVADLLAEDPGVHRALEQRWGEAVFSQDGQVNRKAIADRVFQNEDELAWLEGLLHPLVRKAWQASVEAEPE